MYLHIDLAARRVVPWLLEARERVDAAAAAHAPLLSPPLGRPPYRYPGMAVGIESRGE
jgi:hypothetical protein